MTNAPLPPDAPRVRLQLGAQETTLRAPDGSAWVLAMGSQRTASAFFRHSPPLPGEIEHAIDYVEDELGRASALAGGGTQLYSTDAALHALAHTLVGSSGPGVSRDSVEQGFNQLAARAQGRPAAQADTPDDSEWAARLLILRELMHHLQWEYLWLER